MKKLLFLVACGALLSLASCKKDRDCECTSSGGTTTTTIKKVKKSDAKRFCTKTTYESTPTGGTTNTSVSDCKLK